MFGDNRNFPFMFHNLPPQTNPPPPWVPPLPLKNLPAQELQDVDMSELSPAKPEDNEKENGRTIATGGMRRVFNSRRRTHVKSRSKREDGEDVSENDSEEDEGGHVGPLTQNTSNHYTLNMPSTPPSPSDAPYVLLG